MTVLRRALVVTLLAGALTGALTGCGGGSQGEGSGGATPAGSATNCDLNGCTITFPRNGTQSVSAFGVEAKLVGVDEGSARIEVAGQTITVPVGGTTEVQGLTVGVERVTDTEVVVRVRP